MRFILLCPAYFEDPPPASGGSLTTEDLAQQGIGILIIEEQGIPEQAIGWPKYSFVTQQVFLENVPSGYTNIGPISAYTNHGTWTANFLLLNENGDEDGNGIYDEWELPLAKKFCPNLKLHSGDGGVRPVPVEIMDRNGDNQLGYEDILVDVYDVSPQHIGTFSTNEIVISGQSDNFYYSVLYPYFYPLEFQPCYIYDGNTWILQNWLLNPHFEWGDNGQTNQTNWYSTWTNKLSQHASESQYVNGTTYAHLFKYNDYIIIQYH